MKRRIGPGIRLGIGLGIGLLGLTGFVAATALTLDRLFPLRLERMRDVSPVLLDAEGRLLSVLPSRDGHTRLPVRLSDVDPRYLDWLKQVEDQRFDRHPGIDPLAVLRATGQMVAAGGVVSGASTLTMQVARLLEPRPRTLRSKLIEAGRALQLEAHFTKDEILELYLTLAPFGGTLQGVRAASLAYFGKEPRHLTQTEALLLIALPQAPTARRPDLRPDAARRGMMRVAARLTADASAALDAASLEGELAALPYPLPRDWVRRPLPAHAPHLATRLAALTAGLPTAPIRTTLSQPLQAAVEALVTADIRALGDPGTNAAVMIVEWPSRAVLASLGSHDRRSAGGYLDLTLAVRSPGSTLKPFIYGMGFDRLALAPETWIDDLPQRFGAWTPRNFDRDFQGQVTIRQALQQSLNLPAVALLDRIGPDDFVARLRGAGLRLDVRADDKMSNAQAGLAVGLGGVGTRLVDLVTGYAALADGGRARPLHVIVPPDRGSTPSPAPAPAFPLMSPEAARQVTDILLGAPRPDAMLALSTVEGRRIAYKTGTSYGFRDAWAIGYSGNRVVGVWVGRPDGTPRPGQMGRNAAAPLMFRLFDLMPDNRDLPADTPAVQTAYRPTALVPDGQRRFRSPARAPETPVAMALAGAPRILFPRADSEIELRAQNQGTQAHGPSWAALPLSAEGGLAPYRWYLGEELIASGPQTAGGQILWHPPGPGIYRLTVIDSAAKTASIEVWLRGTAP